jgi:hypothetical protein
MLFLAKACRGGWRGSDTTANLPPSRILLKFYYRPTMSWTDVFPILSDLQLKEFEEQASEGELAELEEWFGIGRTVNRREGVHLVVTSLFWKSATQSGPKYPPPTKEVMMNAAALGIPGRFAPWEHYVQPLLDGALLVRERRPDVVFRVYLAADMEFLIDDLVEVGCEVCVMKSSSLGHNPGAMWRFLAFEEEGRAVTVTDSDRATNVLHDVERTEQAMASGLGAWRMPYVFDARRQQNHPGFYRPFIACHFGVCSSLEMKLLMKAFLWHTKRNTIQNHCVVKGWQSGVKELPIFGTAWPDYGFDEWFLLAAVYPRLALAGILTFRPWNESINHWFALDVEYVTWANPNSEILYFGQPAFISDLSHPTIPARSTILPRLLEEKRSAPEIPIEAGASDPLTLVVARYNENLDWLLELQPDVRIVLYNKGSEISDLRVLRRLDHLEAMPNRGRESDTYLHHLENISEPESPGWTVFCQGNPFPHSPDFLDLLNFRDSWEEVQPLTAGYMESVDVPPRSFWALNDEQWLARMPIYTEQFSLHTMEARGWIDDGAIDIFKNYRKHFNLEKGFSICGHFLEACGLMDLAEQAWRSSLGQFTYGAQLGVKNTRLSRIPKDCLPRMRELTWAHYTTGFVYERMWLHLFGIPFTKPPRVTLEGTPIAPRRTRGEKMEIC